MQHTINPTQHAIGLTPSPATAPTRPHAPPPTLPPDLQRLIEESTAKHWWWDRTLNAHRGCDPVSAGCANCWCLNLIDERLRHNPYSSYATNAGATFHPDVLDALMGDRKPKRYFTPSMSDPFHEDYPDEAVFTFFDALARAPWHWYFVLTKRSERLAELGPYLNLPRHVMAVVSVESEKYLHRIDDLRACGAKRIGISFEPLLGRIALDTEAARRRWIGGLDYAIVGGETADEGKVRPMRLEWAREIRDACLEENVPLFFKQWGDIDEHGNYVGKKRAGRLLDGRTHDDLPRGCAEHLARAHAKLQAMKRRR